MSINERALVGSCLLLAPEDVSCLRAVAEPDDFERRELGAIYAKLLNRDERGEPTGDLALLSQEVASDLGPYDIGACVLHWTRLAKSIWSEQECITIAFDAINEVEALYKSKGII